MDTSSGSSPSAHSDVQAAMLLSQGNAWPTQTALFVQPMSMKNVGHPTMLSYPSSETSSEPISDDQSEKDAASALAQLARSPLSDNDANKQQKKATSKGGHAQKKASSDDNQYRLKRQRNNEAVRRCRMKKKILSEHKDRQLATLQLQLTRVQEENTRLTQLVQQQSAEIQRLRQRFSSQCNNFNLV